MKRVDGRFSASPTDLANFLACRHKTSLDRLVADGRLRKPTWIDPLAEILRTRGEEHEARHVDALRAERLIVVDLSGVPHEDRREKTLAAMHAGADVIVQAALADAEWLGYADVLRKVNAPSPVLGAWSYEAHDTKLSRETRGGTILQLCVYTDLLAAIQRRSPECFHVVTPIATERYRFEEFGAFYRQAKQEFLKFLESCIGDVAPVTYPEPVEHCVVCRWSSHCNAQRRKDDHLSFVAGLGRQQQVELEGRGVNTLADLAALPVPIAFKPTRGSRETYERLREQARLQVTQRCSGVPTSELLPIQPKLGLARLPEPRPGDLFLDLEGDPFGRPGAGPEAGEGGREYLFGIGDVDASGAFRYRARWAFNDAEERAAFEAVMREIMTALEADPSIHVYHYAPYEPSAFRRLIGRYATQEVELDRLLRGGRFIDLYGIVRQALRAGVEKYSIKNLEPFYDFTRDVELDEAGNQRRLVEVALELNDPTTITQDIRSAVEGYNKDDCRSTLELRRWLETLRDQQIAAGVEILRPPLELDEPSMKILERDLRATELRTKLMESVPIEWIDRTPAQHARYLLAHLVDWHRREERVAWGEYHRLRDKSAEDLIDEAAALTGLRYVARIFEPPAGGRAKAVVDRYAYPMQENDVRKGDELRLVNHEKFGTVDAIDKVALTIDVKKAVKQAGVNPDTVIVIRIIQAPEQEESIQRTADRVIEVGIDDARGDRLVNDLLLGRAPRVLPSPFARKEGESVTDFAVRSAFDLDDSLLAIQGPPGAGKTFTGARMIARLVEAGHKVGVVATGHKVIRKLLDDTRKAADGLLPIARKPGESEVTDDEEGTEHLRANDVAANWLKQEGGRLLGGTAWMWARPEFEKTVDVLFVDEAGQMSLANVLAIAPAAHNLVLLGDPQQLDQPQKGSHPDGVDVSALDHLLEGHQTMPEERGIFLPVTWRLAPAVCEFTSEVFYERKLTSKSGLERQRLVGTGEFDGAGLFAIDVEHDGCRNASDEEAEVVCSIASTLLQPGAMWIDEGGIERLMTPKDILVVAPFNAHVLRLQERLTASDSSMAAVLVGTVDKFQGQEAPVVIYSLATSRPEDAPRGMEFLYSLNRLNVATSRARCACILVASPRLFEPECRTPRQMQLANALARYREMARGVSIL